MEALTQAHVRGATDVPLLDLTVPSLLRQTVARFSGRAGLVVRHQDVRWTYGEFARAVDELAAGLLALGLEKGDRIGIWSPNRSEWVVAQFATARIGLILVYTLMVLPIVIWIMRDQFDTIPIELEQQALVDGCSVWGAFLRIVVPIALPGMVAAFILSVILCWNEYFFAALLTSTNAKTLPVMVASQTGSQGINWWSMAALSTAAIMPLVVIGVFLERYIVKGLTAGAVK